MTYGDDNLVMVFFGDERWREDRETDWSLVLAKLGWAITHSQYAVDAVYRFLPREQLFAGVRYNKASGEARNITSGDVSIGVVAGTPVWTDVRTASGRLSSRLPSTGEPAPDQPYLEVRATTRSRSATRWSIRRP